MTTSTLGVGNLHFLFTLRHKYEGGMWAAPPIYSMSRSPQAAIRTAQSDQLSNKDFPWVLQQHKSSQAEFPPLGSDFPQLQFI